MTRPGRYPPDVRARAVAEVHRRANTATSLWAAIAAVAKDRGVSPETLRRWVRDDHHQQPQRQAARGSTDPAAQELRRLRQENAAPRRAAHQKAGPAARPAGPPGPAPVPGETPARTEG